MKGSTSAPKMHVRAPRPHPRARLWVAQRPSVALLLAFALPACTAVVDFAPEDSSSSGDGSVPAPTSSGSDSATSSSLPDSDEESSNDSTGSGGSSSSSTDETGSTTAATSDACESFCAKLETCESRGDCLELCEANADASVELGSDCDAAFGAYATCSASLSACEDLSAALRRHETHPCVELQRDWVTTCVPESSLCAEFCGLTADCLLDGVYPVATCWTECIETFEYSADKGEPCHEAFLERNRCLAGLESDCSGFVAWTRADAENPCQSEQDAMIAACNE